MAKWKLRNQWQYRFVSTTEIKKDHIISENVSYFKESSTTNPKLPLQLAKQTQRETRPLCNPCRNHFFAFRLHIRWSWSDAYWDIQYQVWLCLYDKHDQNSNKKLKVVLNFQFHVLLTHSTISAILLFNYIENIPRRFFSDIIFT